MQLYELTIYDVSEKTEKYHESFFIGVFSSFENAEQIAEEMLKNVAGFKDYPCKHEITAKNVIGGTKESEKINKIWGWDEDEFSNPVRIIESDLFIDHSEAEVHLHILQEKYMRQEWCIDQYIINEVHWRDGFVKV